MHELDEPTGDRISAALRQISIDEGVDPKTALPLVVARGRARRVRARAAVGATGLAAVVLAVSGLMLTRAEPESTVATDQNTPVTTVAPSAYLFDASKPLVDRDLPVTPNTELAVVDGHILSAEITEDALIYSLTDAAGGSGSASADPKQLLALVVSGQGPASNDPTPKAYTLGVTRAEAVRIELVRGDAVVSTPTITHDAFPDLRFFIVEDENAVGEAGTRSGLPLVIAYDSEGRALTDSARVLAAQRGATQVQEQLRRETGVPAELHDVQVSEEDNVLHVRYYGCGGIPTHLATPGPDAVRIRVTLPPEPSCEDKTLHSAGLVLQEPLGGRRVVDDTTGQVMDRRPDGPIVVDPPSEPEASPTGG